MGSCRRTTECPNRALGLVLGKDVAPLFPKQPRCVVQGNTLQWLQHLSPCPAPPALVGALERHSWPGKVTSMPALGRQTLLECLSPLLRVSGPEMLSYSCPLSWRIKVKGLQGLSPQSSALHLLSPSCPGKSTGQPGASHPSFPVSLLGSVPDHPPSQEEGQTGFAHLQPRMPWGPLQHPGTVRFPSPT